MDNTIPTVIIKPNILGGKMSEELIRDAVIRSIASILDIYPEAVAETAATTPMNDELDSLDSVELIIFVEQELAIEINDTDFKISWTPEEFIRYLSQQS